MSTTGETSTHDGTENTTSNVVDFLPRIAEALALGRDIIEESTATGGIFVPEEIVTMAADMEIVATENYGRNFKKFNTDLLAEIQRATKNGDDPMEEVRLWLDQYLQDDGKVLSA